MGYGYDLLQGDNYTLGLSIGLHTMFIKTAFEGNIGICVPDSELAQYCDETIVTPTVVEETLTAPLPDGGIYGSYEFYPGFALKMHAQYFALKYEDVKGSLIDLRAQVEAQLSQNWVLAAGYNYYEVDVDVEQNIDILDQQFNVADYNINYSFTGPMVSVTYTF